MEETPRGRLILSNLVHDFREQRVRGEALHALFTFIESHWIPDRGWSAEAVLESVADEEPRDFICQGPTCQARQCSRVMDSQSLLMNNLDHRRLALLRTDEIPDWLLDILEAGIPAHAPRKDRLFTGKRDIVWVTPTEEVDTVRSRNEDASELASALRDLLGLDHFWQDQILVEVQYPPDLVAELRLSGPTVFDGGSSLIFRTRGDADGWGRAVVLSSMADGLPEAVHLPVPFTAQFRVRRIGRLPPSHLRSSTPTETAPDPWDGMPPDLAEFLARYL